MLIFAGLATVPSPPIQVSTSPDYFLDWLTFALAVCSSLGVIAAFVSLYAAKRQSAEDRRQQEAALQLARDANTATLQTIEEMRAARDQDSAPYVVAYFDIEQSLISFVVKNIGKSVATDIKLSVDQPFAVPPNAYDLNNFSFLKEGIAALAPGNEIRTFYTTGFSYFDDPPKNPRKYTVTISFLGGLSVEPRKNIMTLDLSAHEGTAFGNEKNLTDLVTEVEKIRKTLEVSNETAGAVVNALREGVWIKNPEALSASISLQPEDLLSFIATKLQAFKLKWQNGYSRGLYLNRSNEEERQVNPRDVNTQNDCTLYGHQILFALAQCQSALPGALAKTTLEIATALLALGRQDVFGTGKGRAGGFNEIGENILKKIEEFSTLRDEYLDQLGQSPNESEESDTRIGAQTAQENGRQSA